MKRIFFPLLALLPLLTGCLEGGETRPMFYGFATVVKSPYSTDIQMKTDNGLTLNAIGFDDKDQLKSSDRVLMSCMVEKDYKDKTYDVSMQTCSFNLAFPIARIEDYIDNQFPDSVVANKGISINDAGISRDFLLRDFLNVEFFYYSKPSNSDYVSMVYREEDQENPGEVVLWLHHNQKESSTNIRYNDIRCFRIDGLKQNGLDEVKIIVKYYEGTGDMATLASKTITYKYNVPEVE